MQIGKGNVEMRVFDYSFLNNGLLPANLVNLTASIASLKTMAGVRKDEYAKIFTELEAIAKVQSVKSSNAIEGIVTSDERINAIVNQNSAPLNHNEAEIAGYRDALNTIHLHYATLDFRQSDILRLHEMLMSHAGYEYGGQYKTDDNVILEYIQGMGVVKSFGFEKDSSKSISTAIQDSNKGNLKLVYAVAPYIALQQLVVRVFSVLLLILALYLYTVGTFSLVYGVLFVVLSFTVFNNLESAGSQITMLQMLASSIDTANSVDDTPVMDENGAEITPKNTNIVFENVDFSYSTRKILDHVSISIPEKTTTAIVGPSGSGKTTMCHLIARFWDVNTGQITIGGIDIRNFTLDSLMKNISMVFQNVYLFADTIENNIKFGCPDATHEQVVEAAKRACCHDFISALPDGYNTVIGEGGGTLSGGEKQRISIARAMLKNAPIIILDEATSSVDPENEDKLQQAIEALTHDKTIIMIAHRLKTVRSADQILVLDNAHIVQRGTHAELIQQKGLYADFVAARREAIGWKLAQ